MYATFGSKSDLYRQSLALYMAGGPGWGPVRPGSLDGDGPLKERVAALLWSAVEADLESHRTRGCFACNAAVELGPTDEQIRAMVSKSFNDARGVFRDAFLVSRSTGDLTADADVEVLASLMVCALEGLHVLAKGTRDRHMIEQAIQGAASAL